MAHATYVLVTIAPQFGKAKRSGLAPGSRVLSDQNLGGNNNNKKLRLDEKRDEETTNQRTVFYLGWNSDSLLDIMFLPKDY